MNLTEATILALQGKLVEEKQLPKKRRIARDERKDESVAISNEDMVVNVEPNKTEIVTAEETVTVSPVITETPSEVIEPEIQDVLPEESVEEVEELTVDEMVEENKKIKEESLNDEQELEGKDVLYVFEDFDTGIDKRQTELIKFANDNLDLGFIPENNGKFSTKQEDAIWKELQHLTGKEVEKLIRLCYGDKIADKFEIFLDNSLETLDTSKIKYVEVKEQNKSLKCEDDCEDCEFESIEDALAMIERATNFIKGVSNLETEDKDREDIDIEEEKEEEIIEESFNKESFNKVLSEFYNKKINIESIVKEGKNLKLKGKNIALTLKEVNSKHNVSKYVISESKTRASLVTLLKNNELQCKFITK